MARPQTGQTLKNCFQMVAENVLGKNLAFSMKEIVLLILSYVHVVHNKTVLLKVLVAHQ